MFKWNVTKVEGNKISSSFVYNIVSSNLWHGRLDHVNHNTIKRMMNSNLISKYNININEKYEIYIPSQQPRKSFKIVYKEIKLLELIHSFICDLNILTRNEKRYFISFVDNFSKYCYVFLIRTKYDALNKFMVYKSEVENQLNKKIKIFRSDRGGEYTSSELNKFYEINDIFYKIIPSYSPQSNGVVERTNKILIDIVNFMIASSGISFSLWREALLFAYCILYKILNKGSTLTPHEM